MPIKFEIRENGHVIYAYGSDPITIADYEANVQRDIAHRDSVPFRVHSIINMSHVQKLPNGVLSIRHSPSFRHPRAGEIAMIGTNPVIHLFAETIMRLANFPSPKFFKDEADAWEYLRQVIRTENAEAPTT
jgi:hypothetical protein